MLKRFLIFHIIIVFVTNSYSQNLELWYTKPATKWVEALPIGNGRLGAMIFGGVERDRIQFNEETLWTGYPRDYNRKNAYQYLDTIRQLLFAGNQRAAEDIAGQHFMGLKSKDEDKTDWIKKIENTAKIENPSTDKFDNKNWQIITVPNYDGWETQGFEGMDGAVWFTRDFYVKDNFENKDLILDLNKIAETDYTYINGILVGTQSNADARKYNIKPGIVGAGKNTIAVLVLNFYGKGGILGYKDTANKIGIYPANDIDNKLTLNGHWKYKIIDNKPPLTGQYQAAYQPFGDIFLDFKTDIANVTNYKRSLSLDKAIATTSYTYNNINFKREYLSSNPADAIIIDLSADKKSSVNFGIALTSPHADYEVIQLKNGWFELSLKVRDGSLKGVAILKVINKGGRINYKNKQIVITGADEATLYLTAATSFVNYKQVADYSFAKNRALNAQNKSETKNYGLIKNEHIKDYQKLFNTFYINFSTNKYQQLSSEFLPTDERLSKFAHSQDPSFVALYMQYNRYLLIASSRKYTQPANLQGIWNDLLSPPWGSKYTTNINLEMNYWIAEQLNLSELTTPLFQLIKELSASAKETAKEYYNAPGWVLHHNTDLWRGAAPINASNHGLWVTGAAWLCQHLWEHYLYTKDMDFLKNTAYSLMRSASTFFIKFLIKDPQTGYLISTPSNSPEHGGLVAGPSMDHQIIRALFRNTIAAGNILNNDKKFTQLLENKLKHIAPDRIGKHGQLQEWMQDVDDTTDKHRHVSHLWAVYPGCEINWDTTPALMKAARQSLIYRGDEATGWSLGWKTNLWARFKDAQHFYKLLQMLLSPAIGGAGSYPNLFDAHPPFQIDGNFGAAAGLAEMLVQSQNGYIELLPSLPTALGNGNLRGIKARGGFELDMKWSNNNLKQVTLKSLAGNLLQLKYLNKKISLKTIKNGVYKFNGALQKI